MAELADYVPLEYDHDAVGNVDQFGDITRVIENGGTIAGEFLHHSEDLCFSPDVDASSQVVEEEDLRAGEQKLADDNLLLIATRERADELLRILAADTEILHCRSDELLLYVPA